MDHPKELLHFWRWAESLNPNSPCDDFSALKSLKLVGPFDFLHERMEGKEISTAKNWLVYSRHASDLPEMQTLMSYEGGR